MKTITVPKDKLIETIKKNRDDHRDMFLAAQEKFREQIIEELDKRLERARKGKQVDLFIRLPEPVDYTKSYDTALAMLEWEVDDAVELSESDFNRYVENNWEWAQHWASNTGSYLAT